VAIEPEGNILGPHKIQSSSHTKNLLSLSHDPMTGISDKPLSIVDTCHVTETVHFHTCWPLVRFPPTNGESDTSQSYHQCNGNMTLVVQFCTMHNSH
jgi:hypothetical protein